MSFITRNSTGIGSGWKRLCSPPTSRTQGKIQYDGHCSSADGERCGVNYPPTRGGGKWNCIRRTWRGYAFFLALIGANSPMAILLWAKLQKITALARAMD